ncbi:MAG: sugar ABC transporter permease, partial [Actinobacteria bacterium]|nr:sugar ABC transporter permease [Actinomycetota bacterium]
SDPKIALLCIIIMDIWKDTGLRTIVLLSGMEEIPETFYEAARIDGASSIWQFLKITIPLLRPQIIFLSAVYSINAIRTFSQVYMMTGNPPGGPANSTKVLVVQMYQEAFYSTKFGTGAAISMIIFLFLFGLVILEIKAFSQKSDY